MSLSCSCDFDVDCAWYYKSPQDYMEFDRPRRCRCSSCKELIELKSTVAKFMRYRRPNSDIEDRIYGEDGEIYLADWYLCERCADLYFSFSELGFECVSPDENMIELAKEYAAVYGPKPTNQPAEAQQ